LFSATFRYALISLLEIAGSEDGVNTAVIAQRHNIPGTYLANVLRDLRRLGVIVSQKGRRGGYLLAKPPEQIDLLAMHRGLAGSNDPAGSKLQAPSGAEVWLQAIENRWRQELANTSLRDVKHYVEQSQPRLD
jgi:Rrf2 family protein